MRTKMLEAALSFYGLREIPGSKHEPIVVAMLNRIASWVKDDETPWCSAFMNEVCRLAGVEGTGKLNARSWLEWGTQTHDPKPGDVVVFWRESRSSWKGHVAIFIAERNGYIYCLGGNQGNEVNIKPYAKGRLLEYRTLNK